MKRWAICDVELDAINNEYRPAIEAHTPTYSAWYFKNNTRALVLFAAKNLTGPAADPQIFLLPDLTKDTLLSALSTAQRNAIKNKIEQIGLLSTVDGQQIIATTRPWGHALNMIARQLEPVFDCLAYDIPDVEQ